MPTIVDNLNTLDKVVSLSQSTDLATQITNRCSKRNNQIRVPCKLSCEVTNNVTHLKPSGDPIMITEPGYYVLAENFVFEPKNDDDVAITISTSNVVLDLGGHILSQSIESTQKLNFIIGIVINAQVNDVKIINGIIKNFTLMGIYLDTDLNLPFDSIQHKNILVDYIIFDSIGPNLNLEDPFPFFIDTSFLVQNCQTLDIRHTTFRNIRGRIRSVGMFVIFSKDIRIADCCFYNITIPTNGFAMYAIVLHTSQNFSINNFKINKFFVTGGIQDQYQQIVGIFVIDTGNGFIGHGKIKHHYAVRFVGMAIQDNVPGVFLGRITVKNILVKNNRAETICQGMITYHKDDMLVKKFIFCHNILQRSNHNVPFLQFYDLLGFDIISTTNSVFKKCLITNNIIKSSKPDGSEFSTFAGFNNTPVPTLPLFEDRNSGITYDQCIVSYNRIKSKVVGVDMLCGWTIFNSDQTMLEECCVHNNISSDPNTLVFGFNIGNLPYLPNLVNGTKLFKCLAENNTNTKNDTNSGSITIGRDNPKGSVSELKLYNNCFC
mgnify:CR=1 FL=1